MKSRLASIQPCMQISGVGGDSLNGVHADACRPTNDPQLMTYRSYLDSFLMPFQVGMTPEVEKHNTLVKHKRQSLKRKFTEPGEPGAMFRCAKTFRYFPHI